MKNLFQTTKARGVVLCLALAASFALGYSINNPGPEFYRSIAVDRIEQSLYEETMQIGLLMSNYETAQKYDQEKVEETFQQLRITSGAMIARLYDGYGEPEYDRHSLNYLFGMAHYLEKICLENLTEEEWSALFADMDAIIQLYRTDTATESTLLDELDALLADKSIPIPDNFLTSYHIFHVKDDFFY